MSLSLSLSLSLLLSFFLSFFLSFLTFQHFYTVSARQKSETECAQLRNQVRDLKQQVNDGNERAERLEREKSARVNDVPNTSVRVSSDDTASLKKEVTSLKKERDEKDKEIAKLKASANDGMTVLTSTKKERKNFCGLSFIID
jgi:cell division protein FtsB